MRSKSKKILISIIILGILTLHFYIPRFITEIRNPIIELIRNKTPSDKSFNNPNLKGKQIKFTSFDGIKLSSYLTYSNSELTKGTIILLHGIRSNKESYIELVNKLSNLGFNSIALDSRAHGKSEGKHCTFGVKEKKDIAELIKILEEKENINKNFGIWGKSLGGAIALQALGSNTKIKFGIVESTFSDFKTITNDYFNYHLGFNVEFLTNYLVERSGKIGGFDSKDASPLKYCKTINQPILLIHGGKDKRINIKYSRENFNVIPSIKKEYLKIENANHLNVSKIGGKLYFDKVIEFIEKNTVSNTL